MKAKHIRLDGVIEYEGTPEEIGRVLREANRPQPVPLPAPAPFISAFTITPCQHKWPAVWMSVSPPQCEKCGQLALGSGPTWTDSAGTITSVMPFNTAGCSFANIPGHTTITVQNDEVS